MLVEPHVNLILATDSYKMTHWNQYPQGTETVYSYFESREGAAFPYTVFFGLQYILREFLEDRVIRPEDIDEADTVCKAHFGRDLFNRKGWEHIAVNHSGKLPLRIKAVPEGLPVPTGNVLMTVENTDPKCWWLTNAVESILTHVWYPSTVATLSRATKEIINLSLERTADSMEGLPFMLHDFGYRGATGHEAAAIGGAAHLVNFVGTDTLPAIQLARDFYRADLSTLAFSVPATEHSVMTSLGQEGEPALVADLIDNYPTGILSVVADSYNIYDFVKMLGSSYKDKILERDGVFVVRPDSVTREHPSPATLVAWILQQLWRDFGGTINSKGFKVLDPHVRVLWGDGLDELKIEKILGRVQTEGFSTENIATFGMGGGLLQKVDRDTQRFAFKCSAQQRDGQWIDIWKDPIDSTKKSKKGRLELVCERDLYRTIPLGSAFPEEEGDLLRTVFDYGNLIKTISFDEVRENAALPTRLVAV